MSAIEIKNLNGVIFLTIIRPDVMITLPFISLEEARGLRDALTDMILVDKNMYAAIIKDGVYANAGKLPKNFEEIALADAQRRNARTDESIRKFILDDIHPKEVSDP